MPITIRGAGGTDDRDNVVLRGDGTSSRVFEVKHDYYIIEVRISSATAPHALRKHHDYFTVYILLVGRTQPRIHIGR